MLNIAALPRNTQSEYADHHQAEPRLRPNGAKSYFEIVNHSVNVRSPVLGKPQCRGGWTGPVDELRRGDQRIETARFGQHSSATLFLRNARSSQFFIPVRHMVCEFVDDLPLRSWVELRTRKPPHNGFPPIRKSQLP